MENREFRQMLHYKRLLLYGIGNQFKECYRLFKEKEIMLFDSDPQKWGDKINNLIIYSPEEIKRYIDSETGIVITSINKQYEIAKMLVEKYGVLPDDIFMYTSNWYEAKVYKNSVIQKNWDRIISCSEKFADAASRQYYMNAIMARRQRNPLLLTPNPKCLALGEYGDNVCLKQGDFIVDCGAYTGDTAEMYMRRLNGNCTIYAIEPYGENYKLLEKRIKKEFWQDKVKAFNCAVGVERTKTVIIYNEGDFGMAINLSNKSGRENQEIAVETLDYLFEGQDISYIKMDIEGEEKGALEGARKIICENHPRLMISGYHKIEDFWEIPETIWSINSNYKIYVGHAPGVSTEIEFYCIDEHM